MLSFIQYLLEAARAPETKLAEYLKTVDSRFKKAKYMKQADRGNKLDFHLSVRGISTDIIKEILDKSGLDYRSNLRVSSP